MSRLSNKELDAGLQEYYVDRIISTLVGEDTPFKVEDYESYIIENFNTSNFVDELNEGWIDFWWELILMPEYIVRNKHGYI